MVEGPAGQQVGSTPAKAPVRVDGTGSLRPPCSWDGWIVVEYALLFGLGFLAACMLAMLAAPAIHGRVARFTEEKLRATMPLSPQEVRAQRDAARAAFAAENARATQDLKRERDKGVALTLKNETLARDAQRLASENADLQIQVADMDVEAADFRSSIRKYEHRVDRLKAALSLAEAEAAARVAEARTLVHQLDRVSADVNGLKIDLATRETEVENLKSRIGTLRDERETLRQELKVETVRAREMELRLARDDKKIRQMEARLSREVASNADKDTFLERRSSEVDRLKAQVKELNGELREATRALKAAGVSLPRKERKPAIETMGTDAPVEIASLKGRGQIPAAGNANDLTAPLREAAANVQPAAEPAALNPAFSEEIRARAMELSDRITRSRAADDPSLRDEIADLAAAMVSVTARQEGDASPIPALLARTPAQREAGGLSLAARSRTRLKRDQG